MKFEKLSMDKFDSSKLASKDLKFLFGGERIVTAQKTNGQVVETAEERCAKPGGGVQWDGVRSTISG